MPQISNVKNAVQTAVKKDKWLNAIFAGLKSIVISFGRTFYAFWLQATGLIYLTLTGSGIYYVIRNYHHFQDRAHLLIALFTTFVCFCFTIQSFVKAKRTLSRR